MLERANTDVDLIHSENRETPHGMNECKVLQVNDVFFLM